MEEMNTNIGQTDRRKRINRLKKIILVTLVVFLLIPIVLCVILFMKLNKMEQQIEKLEAARAYKEVVQVMNEQPLSKAPDAGEENTLYPEEAEPEDISENEAEALQDKEPEAEEFLEDIHEPEGRKVYLTFDDGPSIYTDEILDILAQYDVKATFFVVGKTDEQSVRMYQRIVDEGHTLAMHSYSHKYSDIYTSEESFEEDLNRISDYLYEITGQRCCFYRFPGGSSNTVSKVDIHKLISILGERGIEYFDWNIASGDAVQNPLSAMEILENVTGDLERFDSSVVLMHDAAGKHSTVEALPMILDTILSMEQTYILPITEETMPVQHIKAEE